MRRRSNEDESEYLPQVERSQDSRGLEKDEKAALILCILATHTMP